MDGRELGGRGYEREEEAADKDRLYLDGLHIVRRLGEAMLETIKRRKGGFRSSLKSAKERRKAMLKMTKKVLKKMGEVKMDEEGDS